MTYRSKSIFVIGGEASIPPSLKLWLSASPAVINPKTERIESLYNNNLLNEPLWNKDVYWGGLSIMQYKGNRELQSVNEDKTLPIEDSHPIN